jgi:WD40 repeat protein
MIFHQRASALLLLAAAVSLDLPTAGGQEGSGPAQLATPLTMDLPDYLRPATDQASGTTFTRITKPGALGNGVVCSTKYCSHRYSSAQAWNSDQSLFLITNGCATGMCFLDGHTYVPLFPRLRSTECEWHPQNADLMVCVQGRTISTWAPRTNREDVLLTSTELHDFHFGPGKGNPSRDGDRVAVRALRKDGGAVVFAYDLKLRRKFPDIDLGDRGGTNGACSISPLGANILCLQEITPGIEQGFIFSVDGTLRQKWTEHHRPGHGDMTVDDDGSEVYIGISKSDPDKYQVIKRRLSDGKVTSLMKYGESQHASLRALDRPGWVFLSYGGDPDEVAARPAMAQYAQEVIAVRIDGSGEIRRIAQTRSVDFDYRSETHASPSPDGSQVIWSSNWGVPGGPVYDFITHVDWSEEPGSTQKEIVTNGIR